MKRFAVTAAILLALAHPARAGELASVQSPSGVTLQASLMQGDRLQIAILPGETIRLNGRLGVAFDAADGAPVWAGNLPRLVLGQGDYFTEPVLETIDLDPAALEGPSAAAVTFGACLPVTGICVLEEVALTLSRGVDGKLDLHLAMLEP